MPKSSQASLENKCKIGTFSQHIEWTEADGFKIWLQLDLRYEHFNGGSNGMTIAEFRFENGKWSKSNFKGEDEPER